MIAPNDVMAAALKLRDIVGLGTLGTVDEEI
jgi:hypothetical protein